MLDETQLHLVCTFFIVGAALVPVYLSVKLKGNMRKLTIILSLFALIHAGYHVFGFLGLDFLSEGVFEPVSVAALISFGLYYIRLVRNTGKVASNG